MPWQPRDIMNQRTEFALRVLQTDNFRTLCREYEISTRRGYKWVARLRAEGMGGMSERSRRPHGAVRTWVTPHSSDPPMRTER